MQQQKSTLCKIPSNIVNHRIQLHKCYGQPGEINFEKAIVNEHIRQYESP